MNSTEDLGYRQRPEIANSDLKYLHDPVEFFAYKHNELEREETKSYQYTGTMIDQYLLNRGEFFDNYVEEPDFAMPTSSNQIEFIEDLLGREEYVENLSVAQIMAAHDNCYSTSNEKAAMKLFDKLKPAITFIKNHGEKQKVSNSDMQMLKNIERSCMLKPKINELLFEPPSHLKVMKHLQIVGVEWAGVTWKGELDLAALDFENKIIYNIDLKSHSGDIDNFAYAYVNSYYYMRQQALYGILLQSYLVDNNIISADEIDSWIMKTRCLMVRTNGMNQAYLIPVPFEAINLGIGMLQDSAELIKFYNHNGWDVPKAEVVNDGLHPIDFKTQIDEFKRRHAL